MKLAFPFKTRNILFRLQKCDKKKMFPIFEVMMFENVAGSSVNYDENTCDLQSTCYQLSQDFRTD